ncbi:MAG: selenide, water dikinase SelD [Bacteroidales bacterium]|jgi:selenide,water dikinase|nr:selenide, water dikinase SelD [Bacteroidales bacterium]
MKTDLLKFAGNGGCSAKIPARQLEDMLKHLPGPSDPNILVGIDTHDDAGVYRISDSLAIVLTTDFFPPVCSDPYEFGQIAAANSISDIYAMGATPVLALNIAMFPSKGISMEAYGDMLRGGFDKAGEAGVTIIGGHTIDDPTPKYGLAVAGFVHPQKTVTNTGARPGCQLILTKPVGTGIILAGQRMGLSLEQNTEEAKRQMKLLNRSAAEVMSKHGITGATDITGFGLAGHALKMAKASGVTIRLYMRRVPLLPQAYTLVQAGCIPGASFRNLEYAESETSFAPGLDYNLKMAAFDAQTSGGLLISVSAGEAPGMLNSLHRAGLTAAAVIGETLAPQQHPLIMEN